MHFLSAPRMHYFSHAATPKNLSQNPATIDPRLLPIVSPSSLRCNMPSTSPLLLPQPALNQTFFRVAVLAGIIGAVGTLSICTLIEGIADKNLPLTLFGVYGGWSAFREAKVLGKTTNVLTAIERYEYGSLLCQISMLFFSLATMQQCTIQIVEEDPYP